MLPKLFVPVISIHWCFTINCQDGSAEQCRIVQKTVWRSSYEDVSQSLWDPIQVLGIHCNTYLLIDILGDLFPNGATHGNTECIIGYQIHLLVFRLSWKVGGNQLAGFVQWEWRNLNLLVFYVVVSVLLMMQLDIKSFPLTKNITKAWGRPVEE